MDKEEKAEYKVWLLQFEKCTDMGEGEGFEV